MGWYEVYALEGGSGVASLPRLVGHNLGLPNLIVEVQWKHVHHKHIVHQVSLFKHTCQGFHAFC